MNEFNLWEKVRLPPELVERLGAMIRRVRLLQLARGLLATIGVALASVLVIMGVDAAVVIYSDSVRLCLSLAGLALTLFTAYIALWRPLADRITPVRMARIVETRHPELQERISSAIELLGEGGQAAAEGSAQLLEILAADAATDITSVSANAEFKGSTLRPVVISASAVFAILLVLFAVWPRQTALLFARAVAPGAPLGNLASLGFAVQPGDLVIVEGETVHFSLTVPNEDGSRAELCLERPGEPPSVERLARRFAPDNTDAVFELDMPAVRQSFAYRMRLGKALTRRYAVTVVPPPAHAPFECRLDYPAYTGLVPTQFTAAAATRLSAPVGTRAGIRATLNRPMHAALILGARSLAPVEKLPAGEVTFDWLVEQVQGPASWALALRDSRGFTNVLDWAPYEPVPDYAPHVQLTYPSGNSYTLPTFGLLRLVYAVGDDYGLSETRLAIQPDNDRTPWCIDLEPEAAADDESGAKRWTVAHDLSLSEFQMNGARKLRIWLEVTDTLPAHLDGPNVSKSRVVAVNLDDGQKRSLADQVRIPEREALTNLLESAARKLEAAAQKVAAVTNTTDATVINKAMQEAAKIAKEAESATAEATETAEKGLFAAVADDIRNVAEKSIAEEAIPATEAAPLQEEDSAQNLAEKALEALNAAAEETRAIVPEIVEKDKALEEASAIEAVAIEEAREAKKAMERQLTDAEMEKWKAKQEELADKIEQYDLRNDVTDKDEFLPGEQIPESTAPVAQEPAAPAPGEPATPSPEPIQMRDDPVAHTPGQEPPAAQNAAREAAKEARAAAEAAEKAKEADVDEGRVLMARQAETAAKESRRAATEAQRAAEALKALERDREALEAIREAAEKTAKEADELADDALQVRLEAVREVAAAVPPDVAKAMDLARKAETLAALADKALKDAGEGRPAAVQALAAEAEALRKEAEELAKAAGDDQFLKQSAKMAAEAAKRAEETVAGLRAAGREGADAETTQKGLEKAAAGVAEAEKAAAKAVDSAERAADGAPENAVRAATEAGLLADEAEKLHKELQEAIAAARAKPSPDQAGEQTGDQTGEPSNRQTVKPLTDLLDDAGKLADKAVEAARNAAAAENAARRRQSWTSNDTAQKARQAAEAAKRAADAAAQAAKAELAGQKAQADQRTAEAGRQAEDAGRNAAASNEGAKLLASTAAEHAQRAAEAAKRAADALRENPVSGEEGTGNREQGTENGEPPNIQTSKPQNLPGEASPPAAHTPAERAAEAAKEARAAAAAAEKVASDSHENLPVEAARAAREAADKVDAALQSAAAAAAPQPNAEAAKRLAEEKDRRINEAVAAAERAERLAERAASSPDEQVADLANEGRLAARAMDGVADKVAEAARIAEEAAIEKKEAAGDAEKAAAAEAKAEEARKIMEDAMREAQSIGQGLKRLAYETPAVIENADRVAREENAALRREEESLGEEAAAPLAGMRPAEIAAKGARDMQRFFEEGRRTAAELENLAHHGLGHNLDNTRRQAEALSQRAEAAAERAEAIASTPGLRRSGEDEGEEGTGKREQGTGNGEPPVSGEQGTGNREPPNLQTSKPQNLQNEAGVPAASTAPILPRGDSAAHTPATAALADQLEEARGQMEAARATLDAAQLESGNGERGTGNEEPPVSGEQGTGNREPPNLKTSKPQNLQNEAGVPAAGPAPILPRGDPAARKADTPAASPAPGEHSAAQAANPAPIPPRGDPAARDAATPAASPAPGGHSAAQAASTAPILPRGDLAAREAATLAAAAEAEARAASASAARTATRANASITNVQTRAAAGLEASEKASKNAAASAAKLAEAAGKRAAEDALKPASTAEAAEAAALQTSEMFKLASRISVAAGKASAARELAAEGALAEETGPDGRKSYAPATNAVAMVGAAVDKAAEALAESDEALRQARLLQKPTDEQLAAARAAYKAALAMRDLAAARAEEAGFDPVTMKPKKRERPVRDPSRPKRPAQTEKPGGGGKGEDDGEEEEYEDGLSLEMPEWLRKLGFPRSEWLKYKGSLESGLPDAALDKVAPEYRDLVRRYFELLSKEK